MSLAELLSVSCSWPGSASLPPCFTHKEGLGGVPLWPNVERGGREGTVQHQASADGKHGGHSAVVVQG